LAASIIYSRYRCPPNSSGGNGGVAQQTRMCEAPIRRESDSKKKRKKKRLHSWKVYPVLRTRQAMVDSAGIGKSAKQTADEFIEQGFNMIQLHTDKVDFFL
jgi:hypothetical protein